MKNGPTHINEKLLVLYLLEEISAEGKARVEAWLAESDANRAHFASFTKAWKAAGEVDPAAVAFDTDRAWGKLAGRMGEEDREVSEVRKGRRVREVRKVRGYFGVYAAAAILLLAVASVVFVRTVLNRQEAGFTTLASAGEVVQDTLSDGSAVVLNANTTLTVPAKFTALERRVELAGEAFFDVEHVNGKPFIIDAGIGQVKVLGTSFHVKAYPGSDIEVYVESGRVELSVADPATGDTARTILKAGERGMIRRGTHKITTPEAIGADELFWAGKKLIFEETKLSLVFELLHKHYNAVIELKDTAIRDCRLSAIFTDESVDQILDVITASFDLGWVHEKDKYIISGKGCSNEEE
jgi:ferric-dicitrate binding protein FerR (iron transport regulator)